jgi:transketolase
MHPTKDYIVKEIQNLINKLKRQIVLATVAVGEGHIASAFSILDILWVLYDRVLRIDPKIPKSDERDRFILSKGHGSLALYAVLAEKGFFPASELERFAAFDSPLGGHPDCNKVPGVEASTGSLGHGLPMAVGMALGLRIRNLKKRVFVLVGDQECNEGSIWESALLAAHHRLSYLTCIVDYNHSTDRSLLLGDIAAKFAAFGWGSTTINGHDHDAIYKALIRNESGRPIVIVAETVKGFGCKQMENNPAWHHRAPTQDELPAILQELV